MFFYRQVSYSQLSIGRYVIENNIKNIKNHTDAKTVFNSEPLQWWDIYNFIFFIPKPLIEIKQNLTPKIEIQQILYAKAQDQMSLAYMDSRRDRGDLILNSAVPAIAIRKYTDQQIGWADITLYENGQRYHQWAFAKETCGPDVKNTLTSNRLGNTCAWCNYPIFYGNEASLIETCFLMGGDQAVIQALQNLGFEKYHD